MRRPRRITLILTFVLLAVAVLALRALEREFTQPGESLVAVTLHVTPGMSVRAVLQKLADLGLLHNARRAEIYLRLHSYRPNIKAGKYEVPPRASVAEILKLLESGQVVLEELRVVEGSRFGDLRRALERHPEVLTTLRGKTDAEVMVALGHAGEHPEGRFFPDTYRFASKTSDLEILRLAYDKMNFALSKAWQERRQDIPLRTPYEALILASIVEKETGLASERARIAGVFTTRLRRGMRLQSDPTVIYGLGESYDGDIRNRDLTQDTPYNTYTRVGLPPTPVALPGQESLRAAVNPQETGDIFFVATGDGSGAHHFSATLEEHNAAVTRYLRRLKSGTAAPRAQQREQEVMR